MVPIWSFKWWWAVWKHVFDSYIVYFGEWSKIVSLSACWNVPDIIKWKRATKRRSGKYSPRSTPTMRSTETNSLWSRHSCHVFLFLAQTSTTSWAASGLKFLNTAILWKILLVLLIRQMAKGENWHQKSEPEKLLKQMKNHQKKALSLMNSYMKTLFVSRLVSLKKKGKGARLGRLSQGSKEKNSINTTFGFVMLWISEKAPFLCSL